MWITPTLRQYCCTALKQSLYKIVAAHLRWRIHQTPFSIPWTLLDVLCPAMFSASFQTTQLDPYLTSTQESQGGSSLALGRWTSSLRTFKPWLRWSCWPWIHRDSGLWQTLLAVRTEIISGQPNIVQNSALTSTARSFRKMLLLL